MEAKAKARYVRSSARKIRRVAELVKGKRVTYALSVLSYTPKYAAQILEKTIKSAAANALAREGTARLKAEDLLVKNISVDGGPIMKRIRPMGMGRAYLIRKRSAHLTVVLEEDERARHLRELQAQAAKVTSKPEKKKSKTTSARAKTKQPEGK
ncbi:MAG: 50S ribosomal protein L22 [candidate division Zixibacteria bacterium]|nr:50S ribosomal protein L22 [candidate division Zixibacteria bacterium]